MIVVSDTSPLNYLILVDAVEVLPELFGEIHVPPRVMEELARSRAPLAVRRWFDVPPTWLRVRAPLQVAETASRLDPAESEAIALALELQAEAILIDERRGRRVAEGLGLTAVGTLAVLEFAAERDLIDLKSTLERLRTTTFYITDEYIEAALAREAERRQRPE